MATSMALLESLLDDPDIEAQFLSKWLLTDLEFRFEFIASVFLKLLYSINRPKASYVIAKIDFLETNGYVSDELVQADDVSSIVSAVEYGMNQCSGITHLAAEVLCKLVVNHPMISTENFMRIQWILLDMLRDQQLQGERAYGNVLEAISDLARHFKSCRPESDDASLEFFHHLCLTFQKFPGRVSTCLALKAVVRYSESNKKFESSYEFLTVILSMLHSTENKICEIQDNRCNLIRALIQKMVCTDYFAFRKRMCNLNVACKVVDEVLDALPICSFRGCIDALNIIGEMVGYVGARQLEVFYMSTIFSELRLRLRHFDSHEIHTKVACVVSQIGLVVGDAILPYSGDIMELLFGGLGSKLKVSAWSDLLSCLCDLVSIMKGGFRSYACGVLNDMNVITAYCIGHFDEEGVGDTCNNLLRAYSEIFRVLKRWSPDYLSNHSVDYFSGFMGLVQITAQEPYRNATVTTSAVNAVASLLDPHNMDGEYLIWIRSLLLRFPFHADELQASLHTQDEELVEIVQWISEMIGEISQ